MDHCTECDFEYAAHQPPLLLREINEAAGELAARLRSAARRRGNVSRAHPSGGWSVLEYSCHVRDVLLVQRDRLLLALVEDNPSFARMHREERTLLARYAEQDPGQVAQELAVANELFGWVAQGISPGDWDRPCLYNFPAPAPRTVRWLAQHTLHEVRH